MPTTPPTVSPTPTPAIQRGDRTTFSSRVDAFIQWLVTAVTQFNGAASATNTNATEAVAAASTATIQAAAAVSGVNAQVWVSGTTYTAGQARYSPVNGRTYRRLTNGAGTTDPSTDTTNWVLISQRGATPLLHVRDEQPVGQPAQSAVSGYNTRNLNTVKTNTITGASLGANQIALPAGTYRFFISAFADTLNSKHRAFLYNVTDATYVGLGQNANSNASAGLTTISLVVGQITITANKVFEIRHHAGTAGQFGAAGLAPGIAEVYLDAMFWKED